MGAKISRRAQEAKASGLMILDAAARVAARNHGITIAAARDLLGVIGPKEWHHSGWDWKATNFYDPDDLSLEAVAAAVANWDCVEGGERHVSELARLVQSIAEQQPSRFCGYPYRVDSNGLSHSYLATDGAAVFSPWD